MNAGHCGASLSELQGFLENDWGKRLGYQMYNMPVFVEECSMGMCMGSSWIVHTVLGVSNGWSEIQGAWNSGIENGMERWVYS